MATVSRHKSPPAKKSAARTAKETKETGHGHSSAPPAPVAAPPVAVASGDQAHVFEQATRMFHSGNFAAAQRLFEQAAAGPVREMAHSASLHARMCAKRMARPEVSLRTADEHYDYAVALINERQLEQAERHLLLALAQTPKADHLFYALALCRGLSGDLQGAYGNLKRAIELQPRNRGAARNDPDFAELVQLSPISDLLHGESRRS